MKKFRVSVPVNCTVIVEVEAKSAYDAVNEAIERADPPICVQCAKHLSFDSVADDADPEAELVEED